MAARLINADLAQLVDRARQLHFLFPVGIGHIQEFELAVGEQEARAAAVRVQQQETQKAIAAAEQIIAKSREAAQQDYARMLVELKREVGRLVVQTAAAVTGRILTNEDQRRLAEETVKRLPT